MDAECQLRRVNVQSIREKFERCSAPASVENGGGGGGGGGGSPTENDVSPTGFLSHQNRISIKRSPAFRTGVKAEPIVSNKKPSIKRKPGVERTSKPHADHDGGGAVVQVHCNLVPFTSDGLLMDKINTINKINEINEINKIDNLMGE